MLTLDDIRGKTPEEHSVPGTHITHKKIVSVGPIFLCGRRESQSLVNLLNICNLVIISLVISPHLGPKIKKVKMFLFSNLLM